MPKLETVTSASTTLFCSNVGNYHVVGKRQPASHFISGIASCINGACSIAMLNIVELPKGIQSKADPLPKPARPYICACLEVWYPQHPMVHHHDNNNHCHNPKKHHHHHRRRRRRSRRRRRHRRRHHHDPRHHVG